jgi:hypothetical protein
MLGFSLFVIVGSIHVWLQTPKHCQKWIMLDWGQGGCDWYYYLV